MSSAIARPSSFADRCLALSTSVPVAFSSVIDHLDIIDARRSPSHTGAMALPPGPKLSPILQTLRFLLMPTASRDQLTARYGDIYTQRFAFFGTEVTVSDPALIRQVFTGDPDVFHAGEANTMLAAVIRDRSLLRLHREAH